MSRSIHTTKKDLLREWKFARTDEIRATSDMTVLEREDIKKSLHKVNAEFGRQAERDDAPAVAHISLSKSGVERVIRKRRANRDPSP
jgi:hypothetical protein